jgi:hypothetical protein
MLLILILIATTLQTSYKLSSCHNTNLTFAHIYITHNTKNEAKRVINMSGSVDQNKTLVSCVHIIAFAVCKFRALSPTQNLAGYRVRKLEEYVYLNMHTNLFPQ